jgi:hypothetical protein
MKGSSHDIARHWGSGRIEARRSVHPLRRRSPEGVVGVPLTCFLSEGWRVPPGDGALGPMEHLILSQCPGSVEFLRRYGVVDEAGEDSSAWKHRGDVHSVHGSTVLVCSGGGKVVALRRGRIQAILQD